MTVYKTVQVVGTSGTSISDAIRGAVQRASMTLEDLKWFEVDEIRGRIVDGEIGEFQVALSIGFELHAPEERTGDGAKVATKHRAGSRESRSKTAQTLAMAGRRGASGVARGFEEQPGGRGAGKGGGNRGKR